MRRNRLEFPEERPPLSPDRTRVGSPGRLHSKRPPRLGSRFGVQVCHAVQHAHQKGIIHRDLKPSKLIPLVRGDLDWIVMKCLQREAPLDDERGAPPRSAAS
jgi:hypothetical protein